MPTDAGTVDLDLALKRVKKAVDALADKVGDYERWEKNYNGDTELPCAVSDASDEYREIQRIARLPMIGLATDVMAQRIRVGGFEPGTGTGEEMRTQLWRSVWQANKMDARQAGFVHDALTYDKGVVMVSRDFDKNRPVVTVESPRDIHLAPKPSDPRLALWGVKRVTMKDEEGKEEVHAWYIDEQIELGFIRKGDDWSVMEGYERPIIHGMSACPIIALTWDGAPLANTTSRIDRLIGPQRVIDTLRFNLLVNAQTTAFRQKVFKNFDPVLRDANGQPIPVLGSDGAPMLDVNGQIVYQRVDPPKVGAHRALYTPPGVDVDTLDSTSLSNFNDPLESAISHFASVAQVPSSYFQGNMSRVSGAALGAGNATQESFLKSLQAQFSDAIEMIFMLACEVMGWSLPSEDAEVVWEDTAPISLVELGDFASKALPVGGAPREFIMEHLPGSSPQKVAMWIEQADAVLQKAATGSTAALFGNRPMVNDNLGGEPNPVGNNIGND